MTSVTAAITRIAYITSDVLIHSGPAQQHSDPFQSVIPSTTHHPSAIIPLQVNADAAHHILKAPSTTALITVTLSSAEVLTRLLPHLPSFASTPLVIHALIEDDISSVLALRNVIPYIIYSSTAQLAHDHALLAARLARTERKPVLHFFHAHPETVDEVSEDKVPPFLVAEKRPHATVNGHTHSNGHVHPNGDTHVESPPETDELFAAYESASLSTLALVRHALRPFIYTGAAHPSTLLISLGSLPPFPSHDIQDTSLLSISLLRPFPPLKLIHAIPASVNRVIVLEQVHSNGTKWAPLYLDVLSAYQVKEQDKRPEIIPAIIGNISPSDNFTNTLRSFLHHSTPHVLGTLPPTLSRTTIEPPHVPAHEQSYTALLHHLFPTRLEIANAPELVRKHGEAATRPEFALGRVRAQLESREELVEFVKTLVIQDPHANTKSIVLPELHDLLAKWLTHKDDPIQSESLSKKIIPLLSKSTPTPEITRALALSAHFTSASRWIIGSDAWSYDLGSSGLHHLISSSGLNVNILLLDTQPYSTRQKSNSKKDAGLYAMNHGDVYVASIAVYSSYSQALQALGEADKFNGPSVVLAYLPYESESTPALEVLKETKLAVDTGYWPLYRWNPSNTKEPFSLDSEAIKQEVKDFLDRQNHLSQLSSTTPQLASELVGSLGAELKDARAKRAKEAFDKLVNSMEGPSVAILYASDGGNAEKIAKRLAARAKARGLSVIKTETLDSSGGLTEIANLATEGEGATILFVTSTAGQGEPPQNGRDTFKALNAAFAKSEKPFEHPEKKFKFGVFGMGDTHYWPRPEDKGYYNKPGKDLDLRLEQLGGERFIPLGLGDDQDADGFQTGYKIWEPLVWKALGVDSVEVTEAEPEPITNEHIKIASNYLRGTIKEGLADTSTGALAPSDGQLTKFHGIYEQDDRDVRDERKDQGLEPAYAFMIRVRMPGGVCKPEQWLAMDRIADERGNGTFKLTTRQTFQFHGVIKKHLKPSIQAINKALLDTIAACGDVNRNVLSSSLPTLSHLHAQVYQTAIKISEHLVPRTTAYHEIWLDKKLVAGEAVQDFEPLYGPYYLPRKFKIAIAVPPINDVDVFANDVGYIAIADSNGKLVGYNVTAGGGMGVTHSMKKTYPRIGDVLGFCTPDQVNAIAEAIMLTQRDNGNRADRKNARLKYTIDRMGSDFFKAEVEKRLGYKFGPARPYKFDSNIDTFGWTKGYDGKNHFTAFIENGRIQDEHDKPFKTGLREIAKIHKGRFRLTPNQHLIISDVDDADLDAIKSMLAKYKLDNLSQSALRLSSSACVAFPTCGLAMAESERYLPILIDKVEKMCEENGLRNDSIVMRMTGCPNGCARPYIAEIAFVGKALGTYVMLLGGGYHGQRLNKIYRESVTEPEILSILGPMIKRYALERHEGEHFGDWTIRAGYIAPTTSGKEWYDRMGGEGEHRAVTAE